MSPAKKSERGGAFQATMSGRLNGVKFSLKGTGFHDGNGFSRGSYVCTQVPPNMDLLLLNAFLMLGYPSVHRPMEGAVNPFKGLSYRYRRTLTLEDGSQLVVTTRHDRQASDVTSKFTIEGEVDIPALRSVSSVVETWAPQGAGKLAGEFPMQWVTQEGEKLKGVIASEYELPTQAVMPSGRQYLFQQLASLASGNRLEIIQDSELYPYKVGTRGARGKRAARGR
jgi:hypothetical protein